MSDDSSKVEKLQKQLYSPHAKLKDFDDRKELHPRDFGVDQKWGEDPSYTQPPQKHGNAFKTFLAVSILFFVVASGYAAYRFTNNKNVYSNDHIVMEIAGPISISGGEELKLDVNVVNENVTPLELVELIIKYPSGTKKIDDVTADLTVTREDLGTIAPGRTIQKTLNAVLFGEEGSLKQIEVIMEYRVANSNAIFEKKKKYDVRLSGSPIRMTVNALKEIQANQEASFEVLVASNSSAPVKDVLVRVEYPFGFKFIEGTPAPSLESNIWNLGDINPGETKTIEFRGSIDGQNQEERVFKFTTGIQNQTNEKQVGVLLSRVDHIIKIERPFLSANVSIRGETGDNPVIIANKGTQIVIDWRNNLPTAISDAEIEVTFAGSSVNRNTIRSEGGFYRSLDNTLFWNSENAKGFKLVDAGSGGQVSFSLATFPNVNGDTIFRNPEVILNLSVKGKRLSEQNVPEEIKSTVTKKIKVMTDVNVNSYSLHSEGPFENTGPFPPRAEQLTTYTARLDIRNTANAVSEAKITAKIPSYAQWKNVISPIDKKVTFDPISRELVWDIGDIAPGVGYSSEKNILYFQVAILPSLSQLGDSPALVNLISFEGKDTFTGKRIRYGVNAITTRVEDRDSQGKDNTVTR